MFNLSESDADTVCHAKAKQRGQRTFTLVEQDISSARTIAFWILENINTSPREKLVQALNDALDMRDYPNKKFPD